MFMRTSRPARVAVVLSATALTFGAAACGSDDDGGDDAASATTAAAAAPTTAAAAPTTAATDGSAPAGGGEGASVEAFCEAELAAEAAAQSEDPAAAEPAFEALIAAAPDDIRATAEAVIAAGDEGPGTPAFDEPYGEMIQYMKDNCGFNEMEVTAADYSFEGVPTELAAGEVIISMENTGEEVHEVSLYRINDDTTESVADLLAIQDEEELMSKVTQVGGAFAFPGQTGFGTANLDQPGSYLALCSVPVGLTPEVAEQVPGPEATLPPDVTLGPPHHTEGMVAEFTVT